MNDVNSSLNTFSDHTLDKAEELLRQLYSNKSINSLPYTHHFVGVALEALQEERASTNRS